MQRQKMLTASTLKWSALITMLIDHIGAVMIWYLIVELNMRMGWLITTYYVMRTIGRLSFPLYCYLLVEGFYHTRSKGKYLRNMGIFAIISEIPFDMAFYLLNDQIGAGTYYQTAHSNVFFTLFLGLLAMMLIDMAKQHMQNLNVRFVVSIGIAGAAAGLAQLLHTDYAASGVVAILIIYALKDRVREEWQMLCAVLALCAMSSVWEAAALIDVLLVHFYNGEKGRSKGKWFFYAFYPAHLIILVVLRYMIR